MSRGISVRTSPNASTTTMHLHSSLTATKHSACRPGLLEDSSAYRLRATSLRFLGAETKRGMWEMEESWTEPSTSTQNRRE